MSSIDRPLAGSVLLFALDEERERAADRTILERSGRNARTLLKEGPLRVTLVVLAPAGEIQEHEAAGPITVQVLEGRVRFRVGAETYDLRPGSLLMVPAEVRHAVASDEGGTFLLTVSRGSRSAEG